MMQIVVLLLSYLIGSIPSGLIVGKVFYGIDIREHGSGNLGGTNTFRVLGKKAGIAVTAADILKGTAATFLPTLFSVDMHPLLAGVFAVLGHTFPVFAGFRGGKAVATSAGVLLGYEYWLFIVLVSGFLLTLKISKYVSLSSMVAGLFGIIYCIILGDWVLVLVVSALELFVIYRHRANLKRIRDKTEPKVKWI
ncbi:glycerol-3-phosphate 1-O-acyltransferase PlsY [Siminovitchia sp. FSL H7-0308]|uniref:Glycerol-3-phosphate acyltransferase n=1 Tax=Siminovitchia thermophila TaxID=1245522 RepID=A0ABS2RCC8_9BACI|nr:glycerol-3-phosphate 1-O-acyltransferase PlsY [Siminovitchia thermophila]MBM7717306.1 glycerol-3-phosphate acyltransferase PlsY [Siminovitchia thermophila]ONK22114.1 glycerol-3-phosphate acyltransferase [Bacillus sp. VT-16-64]